MGGRKSMQKFINWLSKNFAPKVNKITRNVWIQSIQSAIMAVLPMVFVGSLITVTSIIKNYIPSFPDLSPIGNYSFGLIGLFISFLMPYTIWKKRSFTKVN
jgi:PTS system cellobiose-specific IIC component